MSDYNGWKNYETWNVHLWLTNDSGTDAAARQMACHGSISDGSQALKEFVEEMMPDLGASMFADLLGAALSEVDWYEIAESFREDMEEETDNV